MREENYVEETTTSIASSGAGAITLTAVTNRPRFSTVFGTQNTDVRYIIEDTVNKKIEIGLGKVSSNVLTRTRPQETWDGTTWLVANPSALTFTGSPSSGDIKIRMAATAAQRGSSRVGSNLTVTADATWRDYPFSGALAGQGNGASYTLTADREYYCLYKAEIGGALGGIQLNVATNIAASNFKWALYGCGYDGFAGAKIVDFVTTSSATTGAKADTATASWTPAGKVQIAPGWVIIGLIPSHAIAVTMFINGDAGWQTPTPYGRFDGYGYAGVGYVAGSYSTGLPASPSSPTLLAQTVAGALFAGLKIIP